MKQTIFLCFVAGSLLATSAFVNAQPQWCGGATIPAEHLICEDDDLGALDVELTKAYRAFFASLKEDDHRRAATIMQRHWIKSRNTICGQALGRHADHLSYRSVGAFFQAGARVDFDFYPYQKDPLECLKNFYREAISSLESGVLRTHLYFLQEDESYDVGLPGISKMQVEKIKANTTYPEIALVDYQGSTTNIMFGYDNTLTTDFIEFRAYLAKNGKMVYGIVFLNDDQTLAGCVDTFLRSEFFNPFSMPESITVDLYDESDTCYWDHNAMVGWSFSGETFEIQTAKMIRGGNTGPDRVDLSKSALDRKFVFSAKY